MMDHAKKIVIGIHLAAEPENLHATLIGVVENTALPFTLMLLIEGNPEAFMQAGFPTVRRVFIEEGKGAAACFNRMVAELPGDIYVFLENGAIASPGWMDYLLGALDADPSHGLAGPSTNSLLYGASVKSVSPSIRASIDISPLSIAVIPARSTRRTGAGMNIRLWKSRKY